MGSIVFQDESREISTDSNFTLSPEALEISMINLVNKPTIQMQSGVSPFKRTHVAGTDIAFSQPHIQFRPI